MLTTEAIAERVTASELGTTFGGGPLACRMIEATAQTIIART
jgi:acetylornithine/succinyldiaminopimelate/putrescine aminotransferase